MPPRRAGARAPSIRKAKGPTDMSKTLLSIASTVALPLVLSLPALGQTVPVTARGVITNVPASLTSGPFAGAATDDIFTVLFRVQLPGVNGTQGSGSDSFTIVPGSAAVQLGSTIAAQDSGSFTLDVNNDVSFGDTLSTLISVGGGLVSFQAVDSSGLVLSDVNLANVAPRSFPAAEFTVAEFAISDGVGGFAEGDLTAVVFGGDEPIDDTYCLSQPNSTGANGLLRAFGSTKASDNDVVMVASNLPTSTFGYLLASQTQSFTVFPGGSQGTLCLGGDIGRYVGPGQVQNTTGTDGFSLAIDLTQTPQPNGFVGIASGETWNFQVWHRDVGSQPTSNFSSAIEVTFD